METFRLLFLILTLTLQTSLLYPQSATQAIDLKTEYLKNPIGLDTGQPRFTWKIDDKRQGVIQFSYQISLGTDSLALIDGKDLIWDSGKVRSESNLVTYSGPALRPFTKYYWKLQLKAKPSKKATKPIIASFETGLMNKQNWKGAWISDGLDINLKPAPYFRNVFVVSKRIKSARAYIAVAGLYELYINGNRIGSHRLDPMYTRFDRRTLYITHDVTTELSEGKNAIGVILGNGWYNMQSTAVWDFHVAAWRARPTFCLDLRITYEDGTVETISSGKKWKTSLSPIIFNSIYTAEHYDARKEQDNWNLVNFDDTKWTDVILRSAPSSTIVAQTLHPIRDVEVVTAKEMKILNDTTYVFDLGRNISGVTEIKVRGAAGTILKLKHGERLYSNGHIDMSNIDLHYRPIDNSDPFQTDIFILRGKGIEKFKPRFNYKGFQYVEITSNKPVTLTRESLVGYFMHSDVPPAGRIHSSNQVIDKIWAATNNSYLSNLFGYPTDCPQREKNGWTGDAQIAIETGLYSFDGITIYEKWLADHRDEQQPNGVLPSIIPTSSWGYEWGNGPDWTSTIAIIPWSIYQFYGDKKLLSDCYDNIKRYVDYIDQISPTGITAWGLGDWVPVKSKTPVELTSTCYYYTDVTVLSKAAKMFNKQQDFEKYTALAARIKEAFNAKYLNKETGIYGSGVQTELSVPLYWGLVPDEYKSLVAANLAKRVEADNFHLDVGLLGQKAILNALSENGYGEVAYKIAAQKTYPSWGWWIENGATTLYENWNIDAKNDISLNHIMFGEIGAWLYKGPGGIKPDPRNPGFKNILLNPLFVNGLDKFEAEYNSPFGLISSSWTRLGNNISYTINIPANSTATLTLPVVKGLQVFDGDKRIAARILELGSGNYTYTWK